MIQVKSVLTGSLGNLDSLILNYSHLLKETNQKIEQVDFDETYQFESMKIAFDLIRKQLKEREDKLYTLMKHKIKQATATLHSDL